MSNINIGIIQTTRIGDVIQTAIACQQVKRENPSAKFTLITRKKFSQGLEFYTKTIFDDIYYIDTKTYLNKSNNTLKKGLESLDKNFFEKIAQKNFNVLINLSFSKSSSYLLKLIKAQNKLGLNRNDNNQLAINDQWSQYVYSCVQNGNLNPYNLVDIFKFIIGAKQTDFQNFKEINSKKMITLHPFASQRKKMWTVAKWTELIYKTLKEEDNHVINIVGSKEDEVQINKLYNSPSLESYKDRINTMIGESIEAVSDVVKDSSMLICHDSMVSHLGAIHLTPTIVISLGVVRPNETTPYNPNVLNLVPRSKCFPCTIEKSCELLPCHKDISYQLVHTLTQGILKGELIDTKFLHNSLSPFHLDSCDIYMPTFDNGFMTLTNITNENVTHEQVVIKFYRMIWSYFFKEIDVNESMPQLSNNSKQELYNLREGVSNLFELLNFGMKFSNAIINESQGLNPNIDQIKDKVQKLGEIDELLLVTKNTFPLLQPLVDYFYVAKSNVTGHNIKQVSENSLLLYYSLNNMCKVLYDLITDSIKDQDCSVES